MTNRKISFLLAQFLFCAVVCFTPVFNCLAQKPRTSNLAPSVTASLTDSFYDGNGDGRADPGVDILYTTTIANNGTTDATNVGIANTISPDAFYLPRNIQVRPDVTPNIIRCLFSTANASVDCSPIGSNAYGTPNNSDLNTIIGGQGSFVQLTPSNASYNPGTGVFQFDATLQNLLRNSLGTIDGTTPDAAGVRIFLYNSTITSGTGNVSIANPDGTYYFTDVNQPYFQYNQILQTNQTSGAKTFQVNAPASVNSFTMDFLISTKAQVKVVINEVLTNPGGTITDAAGEWFELYNAGDLPVNLEYFQINDFLFSGGVFTPRPSHQISGRLVIQPGRYKVFGSTRNTTNNGGVPVDYAYGAALALANGGDGVRLQTPYPESLTLDEAKFSNQSVSAKNGISRELKNPELDNSDMDGANWADASVSTVYGPGGRGTPGAQNAAYTPFAGSVKESVRFSTTPVETNLTDAVSENIGTISPGGSATVTYEITLYDPLPPGVTMISNQGSVTGDNFAPLLTDDPTAGGTNDPTMTPVGFAPTAARVFVSGRVVGGNSGIARATVSLVDSRGIIRTAKTNTFGYFRFDNVEAGQIYIFNAAAKGYSFAPQVVSVSDEIAELNFIAIE